MGETSFLIGAATIVLASSAHADLSISKRPTHGMTCNAGVCTATAKSANLKISYLGKLLAKGDVAVKTGAGAVTISIADPFAWASAHRLTLDAEYNIAVHAPIAVQGAGGALTITYTGDLRFFDGGKIDFWDISDSLIINDDSYALVADIRTLTSAIGANPSGSFALAKDYDASGDGTQKGIKTTLLGRVEGLGHTLANISANSALFYEIGSGATVRDLNLQNANVSGKDGAATFAVANAGLMKNVSVSGSAHSCLGKGCSAGGMVVSNTATGIILNATVSATVQSGVAGSVGGIAAGNDGSIINSVATGSVKSYGSTDCCGSSAGGLAGYNGGTIVLSRASAQVDGGGYKWVYNPIVPSSGGLVGTNAGVIDWSFAIGTVVNGYAGGLVGVNRGTVENSYSFEPVTGFDGGGLVGNDYGRITSSYSTGATSANGAEGWSCPAGGFTGCGSNDSANGYWDIDTSGLAQGCGQGSCAGVTGLTDAELKSGLPAGFDPNIWGSNPSINNGYPYLLANPPQ